METTVWSPNPVFRITDLGCVDPLDSGEGPFLGEVAAFQCLSWIHNGYLLQSPCRAYHQWAYAFDACLPVGSRQIPL